MPEHRKLIGSPFISLVDSILSATIAVDIAFCLPNTMTYKVQILSLEDQIVIYSKHFRRTTPTWAPSCLSIFALTCSQATMQNVGDFLHRKEDPMAFCVKDHPRPTSGMLEKTRGWMGFSVPGEGKIDDIDLTSKQRGWGIQNFVVFVDSVVYADRSRLLTQTIIKSPRI